MSTDKALDILRSRQFLHQRHCTPDADNPLCHTPCRVMHDLLYCATNPPSTVMVCPVTNEAASEQSQTTASAISSGCPIRPTGSLAIIRAIRSGSCIPCAVIGVAIYPGQTQLTRIPCCAYSNAAVFVRPTTPCLLATYAALPVSPTNPATEAVLITAPPPCWSIWPISYFIHSQTP